MQDYHLQGFAIWQSFLRSAFNGISINNILERKPDHILVSDSCPHSLGGLSITKGWAWRLQITEELLGKVTNNFLEWLAEVVTTKLAIYFNDIISSGCMIPVGDSTSALSWIHGADFYDASHSALQDLARVFKHIMF